MISSHFLINFAFFDRHISKQKLEMAEESVSARSALILYGSETGNAQEVAEELGRIAERLHFVAHVKECNGVKAVSPNSFHAFHETTLTVKMILERSGVASTCHFCRSYYWTRRFSTQCSWILENTFAEKTPRNFSQRR